MTTEPKIMDYGTLHASTDSWLLVREHVQLLEIPFEFDTSMEGKEVSVIGIVGTPSGSTEPKLIVEKIVLHNDIALALRPSTNQVKEAPQRMTGCAQSASF